jgi:hypothetical protein
MEKLKFLTLPGLELRPLGRPARSQSLYRQSYCSPFSKLANCFQHLAAVGTLKTRRAVAPLSEKLTNIYCN